MRVGQAPIADWEYFRQIMQQYPTYTKANTLVGMEGKPVELPMRKDIRSQFLLESSLLTLMSGAAGVILGVVSSLIFSRVLGWQTIISPNAIVLSFLFSAVLGVFFGFYPARQAAMLNPIEALRWE